MNHQELIKWMNSHKPLTIMKHPVWIVPNSFVIEKIAIRPYRLIFISDKVPKEFLKVIVFHEIIEEKNEKKFGGKRAHEIALVKEYNFLKKIKLLKRVMVWLKTFDYYSYNSRIKLWKKEGFGFGK